MAKPEMRSIGIENTTVKGRPADGLNYLFVIAVDNYEEGKVFDDESGAPKPTFRTLKNPVADASRLVKVLLDKYTFDGDSRNSKKKDGYPEEVIEYNTIRTKCLYNNNATQSKITAHLLELEKVLTEKDKLLIYFAGHGTDHHINSSGCFIPYKGIADPIESGTWFPFQNLYSLFGPTGLTRPSKCLDLLIILDCCFAGRAALGAGNNVDGAFFSRKVLVSSSPQQTAADGEPYQGSPFANALCHILKENTHPLAELDIVSLQDRFKKDYVTMYEEKPEQDIFYNNLPTYYGEGNFFFELKEKNAPDPNLFTEKFVRFLNFTAEKQMLEEQYANFCEVGRHSLIITREPDRYVRQLLKAVLFSRLGEMDNADGCALRITECFPSRLPLDATYGFDLWKALIATCDAGLKPNPPEAAADKVAGWLLSQPVVFSLQTDHLTKDYADRIIGFCGELGDSLDQAKQRRKALLKIEESYHKLFFVIPDTREKGSDFFDEDELNQQLQGRFHLLVNEPKKELRKGQALDWFEAVKTIGAQNIQDLKMNELFPKPTDTYPSVLNFIYSVCEKVKVDKMHVEHAISNYKP
ncbi:MAG: caspase family protein [Proteobacteria bacterium]|nr:MAG: caspase family protein [Pseudomonadota bacterium]